MRDWYGGDLNNKYGVHLVASELFRDPGRITHAGDGQYGGFRQRDEDGAARCQPVHLAV